MISAGCDEVNKIQNPLKQYPADIGYHSKPISKISYAQHHDSNNCMVIGCG